MSSESVDLTAAVQDAMTWLKGHPRHDWLDAAYAVAASEKSRTTYGAVFCTGRWPELAEAVRLAAQNAPDSA